jgi:hypothetical protein
MAQKSNQELSQMETTTVSTPTTKTSPLFAYHKLNESGQTRAQEIAHAFTVLLTAIESLCPHESREMSIVRTKLEEASFFAKKAMAKDTVNQAQ